MIHSKQMMDVCRPHALFLAWLGLNSSSSHLSFETQQLQLLLLGLRDKLILVRPSLARARLASCRSM